MDGRRGKHTTRGPCPTLRIRGVASPRGRRAAALRRRLPVARNQRRPFASGPPPQANRGGHHPRLGLPPARRGRARPRWRSARSRLRRRRRPRHGHLPRVVAHGRRRCPATRAPWERGHPCPPRRRRDALTNKRSVGKGRRQRPLDASGLEARAPRRARAFRHAVRTAPRPFRRTPPGRPRWTNGFAPCRARRVLSAWSPKREPRCCQVS